MKPIRFHSAQLLVLIVLVIAAASSVRAADTLEAGMGVSDITPTLEPGKPIWLGGKENDRTASGVHDPLYARALVLRAGGRKIALVSVDSIGLPYPSVERARGEFKEFAYGRKSAQYGERNSVGPETARMLMEALADRVAEAPAR